MIGVAALAGYVWGGLPTADWIAGARGLDLRMSGSGNPGANNARRVGGVRLALAVLVVEASKGAAAVGIGWLVAGSGGAAAAGVAATLGNVLNPWRGFRGGQGLGITGGVLIAAAPVMALTGITVIAVVAAVLRSAPIASIIALATAIGTAALDPAGPWGITAPETVWLGIGVAAVILPKQVRNLLTPRDHPARRATG